MHKVVLLSEEYGQDQITALGIIKCESNFEDRNNTTLNKNGTIDYSYWQINEAHKNEALKRGFDITHSTENLEYGMLMLKEKGTQPWTSSKNCWQPMV